MKVKSIHLGSHLPPPTLTFFVRGKPAPQGSKRYLGNGRMIEDCHDLPAWRSAVEATCLKAMHLKQQIFYGAVHVNLAFVLYRPKSTPKNQNPAATKKPDIDKLQRAIFDGITKAGAWGDDSQVTGVVAFKRIAAPGEELGCFVVITEPKDTAHATIEKKDIADGGGIHTA